MAYHVGDGFGISDVNDGGAVVACRMGESTQLNVAKLVSALGKGVECTQRVGGELADVLCERQVAVVHVRDVAVH